MNLNLNLKKFSAFVQTDKSIYKPSDKILFRVLLLDIDTKPFESSNVQIYITDGAQNRVKQFLDPKFKKGVFEGELELSDSPVMGNWTIFVKVDNHEERKEFDVAEYVLPKFEVIVDANPHVVFSDGKIHATVSGKYTFGKLTKGKATVTARVVEQHYGWNCEKPNEQKVEKIVDVDGKKDVEFDIREELKIIAIDDDKSVEIEAKFVEELSGKEHKGSAQVTIHKTAHKIDIVKSNEKVKPGLPYSIAAHVKTHDGAPIKSDTEDPVNFVITYYRLTKEVNPAEKPRIRGPRNYYRENEESTERKFENVSLANGIAKLSIEIPINVTRIEADIQYLKTTAKTHQIYKYESKSGHYIQLNLLTKK